MNFRIVFAGIVGASTAIGCFQTIDNGVVGGGPQQNATTVTQPLGVLVDAGFPTALGAPNLGQQCAPGSALCFQLCNSPECGTDDGGGGVVLPPVLLPISVVLPDGGESTNPCDQLEAESMRIRADSCSQCHSPVGAKAFWTWVLDDSQLVTNASAPGLTAPVVVPGNPNGSVLLQKMELGLAGGQQGMPPSDPVQFISADAAATVVFPTPEDVSIMYAWILACAPGADAGALSYQANYGGGNWGPEGGSTVSVSASPVPPPATTTDAGH